MAHPQWIVDLFATIDNQDAKAFASFIAQDGQFRFGNWPAAVGRDAIIAATDDFFSNLASLSHSILGVYETSERTIVEGSVLYTLPDGRSFQLGFCNVFTMAKPELVQDYLVYADVSPLFTPAEVS